MRVALIVSVALLAGTPARVSAQLPTPIPYPVVPPASAPSLFAQNNETMRPPMPPGTVFDRNKELLPVLLAASHDKNLIIRQNATEALRSLGVSAIPSLVDILNGHDTANRIDAAVLLGNSGPKAEVAMPILLRILKDTKEPEALRIAVSKTISLIVGSGPLS